MTHEEFTAPLVAEFNAWLSDTGFPSMSADDLICELQAVKGGEASAYVAAGTVVTEAHIEWLSGFITRWDKAEANYAAITEVEFFFSAVGLGQFKRRCTGGNNFAWVFRNVVTGLECSFVNDDAFAESDDPYWQFCVGFGDHQPTASEHEPLSDLAAAVIRLQLYGAG